MCIRISCVLMDYMTEDVQEGLKILALHINLVITGFWKAGIMMVTTVMPGLYLTLKTNLHHQMNWLNKGGMLLLHLIKWYNF